MDGYGPIIHKRRSFLSTLVISVSAIVITVILTAGGVAMYGLNIVDRKTDNVFDLARVGVDSLPDFVQSLPPMLADVVNHERDPEYTDKIAVSAHLVRSDAGRGYYRPVVEVKNLGGEVVSLLSMRVTVMDENGEPIAESGEYAATPVAIDNDWRGPLMPHATPRCFRAGPYIRLDPGEDVSSLKVLCEITDVRVWHRPTKSDADGAPAAEKTMANMDNMAGNLVPAGRV